MIVFKGVLARLAAAGWSTYRIRREKVLPESTLTRLRQDQPITTDTIDVICRLCHCQPGDLLEYVEDEEGK